MAHAQYLLGGAPPLWQPPRIVRVFKGPCPVPLAQAPEFEASINQAKDEDGRNSARGVVIAAVHDGNVAFPRAASDYYELWYPPLHIGDIAPVLGERYRVQAVSGDAEGRSASIQLLRLPDPEGPAVPKAASVSKGTYAFLFENGDGNALHYTRFRADFVPAGKHADGDKCAAVTIRVGTHSVWVKIPDGKRLERRPPRTQTARVGDLLRIGDAWHRVRNIVPPDRENHVIGWFEIDQKAERMGDEGK
jgi:hypothetical protein